MPIRSTVAALLVLAAAPGRAEVDPDVAAEAAFKAAGSRASAPSATIAYGVDPLQVADLRVPRGKGPFPVAVLIHGGCWRADVDDRTSIAAVADALGKQGIATWNVGYRRTGNPGGGWPGSFQDIAAAIDKLPSAAGRYHLDMARVSFVGHSAGAHLALWAASRPKLGAPWSGSPVHPVSVVAIDGPATLARFIGIDTAACGRPVIVPFMGGTPKEKPAEYLIASPADHLPLGVKQLSVGADFAPLMKPYVAAARASGDTVEVLDPKNANHFDVVTPGTPNGDAVVDFIAKNAFPQSKR